MALKDKLRNPLIQQYILEIALPLVGYFFFGWTIPVIIAFYFVDYLASEVARNRRVYKVFKTQQSQASITPFFVSVIIALILYTANLFWCWHYTLIIFQNKLTVTEELTAFAKEELWLLVPVVYFVYHFKDVLTFYMPRKFMKCDYKKMVRYQMVELVVLTILTFAGMTIWAVFSFSNITVLISFIVLKLGFDILLVRSLKSKYREN